MRGTEFLHLEATQTQLLASIKTESNLSTFGFMFRNVNFWFFAIVICVSLWSCRKELPNGGKPFYLEISDPEVSSSTTTGSALHNISDVWVQAGPKNLGVYSTPASIPVLTDTGTYTVVLQAGIKNNGTTTDRKPYPFYASQVLQIAFTDSQKISIKPRFEYVVSTRVALNEGFESGNAFTSAMTVVSGTPDVLEGTGSGLLQPGPSSTVEAVSATYSISTASIVYVEMNYKNDVPMTVGIESNEAGTTVRVDKVTLFPKLSWGKVYIEFTPQLRQLTSGSYRFYIKAINTDSSSAAKVFVDNFKVLYL